MGSGREYPDKPLVGVATLLFRDRALLLVRRARPPRMGEWSFPGGAQMLGETAEAAARRELREETGLAAGALRLAGHADVIEWNEARVRFHYTILHFAGDAADGAVPLAGDDVSEAAFVPIDLLERLGLDLAHRSVAALASEAREERPGLCPGPAGA